MRGTRFCGSRGYIRYRLDTLPLRYPILEIPYPQIPYTPGYSTLWKELGTSDPYAPGRSMGQETYSPPVNRCL